jgi:hypothetical protein
LRGGRSGLFPFFPPGSGANFDIPGPQLGLVSLLM